MKLYLLSQDENNGYDTYDSCVVAAENQKDARRIHPSGNVGTKWDTVFSTWCKSPSSVKVELIGEAAPNVKAGVICSSFNAG